MVLWSQDYLHFNKSQKTGDGCGAAYSLEIHWEYQFQHYSESRTAIAPQLIAEQRGSSSIISILWLQTTNTSHEVGWQHTLRSWNGCQFESHLDRERKNSRAAAMLHWWSHTKFKVKEAQGCTPRFVGPHFTAPTDVLFTDWRRDPSPAKRLQFALLRSGTEPTIFLRCAYNPQTLSPNPTPIHESTRSDRSLHLQMFTPGHRGWVSKGFS